MRYGPLAVRSFQDLRAAVSAHASAQAQAREAQAERMRARHAATAAVAAAAAAAAAAEEGAVLLAAAPKRGRPCVAAEDAQPGGGCEAVAEAAEVAVNGKRPRSGISGVTWLRGRWWVRALNKYFVSKENAAAALVAAREGDCSV